jgi:hypothetical protein
MEYHLWEGLTMLCEIAAYPGWPGADKLEKRRRNVQRIHDWYRDQQGDLATFGRVIDGISAAPVFTDDTDCMQQVDACMREVKCACRRHLRDSITAPCRPPHRLLQGRQWVAQRVATLLQRLDICRILWLQRRSGVGRDAGTEPLPGCHPGADLRRRLRDDHPHRPCDVRNATAANCRCACPDLGAHMTIEDSLHSTVRATGISYERTLVIFDAPRSPSARVAKAILTLTTAGPVGCPFRTAPTVPGRPSHRCWTWTTSARWQPRSSRVSCNGRICPGSTR